MDINHKKNCALILIDLQKGFHESNYWGKRNNPNAEEKIIHLLSVFREQRLEIIHVQHLSTEENSPLRPGQNGAEFISGLGPLFGERVFQKSVNSAFIGTSLENYLRSKEITTLAMAGFTSDHCVSTTARMASNQGYEVSIVHDATVTFDRAGIDGAIYPAELVHQVSMASLNKEFVRVLSCNKLERLISERALA
ncbi:MAG: cysteine hydrolase family protein [Bacteriovorax sp.]